MRVIKSIQSLQRLIQKAKRSGESIGFVPTMGALHQGHQSLIRCCRRENKITVLSIFVNPQQFGPHEDFLRYPRPGRLDKMLAEKEKVDIIFTPTEKTMYPDGYQTTVIVGDRAQGMCGRFRPGHFQGVATVVIKLLHIVMPDRLYLGEKDAQQVAVLRQVVRDLNFPVTIRVCPTVREKDGLAMSSRNRYLSAIERNEAAVLYHALQEARFHIRQGMRNAGTILRRIRSRIQRQSSATIDYIVCVDRATLKPLVTVHGKVMLALAVRFGRTRLIDNILVNVP